ncbi:MAG: transcriptional regulator [Gemmatimonadaceae bacterium]
MIDRARDAVACGEWARAHELLTEADDKGSLTATELALRAEVAYASGHLDVTIDAWERAHAQGLRAGDNLVAAGAAIRVAMHLLFDTALMAPVRGWISRTERLLAGCDRTPVHAWVAVVHCYERLLSGDFDSAQRCAREAIDIGTECNAAAAAIARVAEARALILAGDVSQGLRQLNEAAVAAVSGELDPLFTGMVYCEVVCAFQALAQYDLAEQWTSAMEAWCRGQPVGSLHGRCRVHRAEILRLRGSCREAEREALSACEELRPWLRREFGWPLTELGRIRLRRGDITGAEEAFRAAHETGWDPQPGLALVHLAKGDVSLATHSIRHALSSAAHVPSKELPPHTELRRAPLLEAQVEIELAAGNVPSARTAALDLSRIAAQFESKALVASAALALGRVALAEAHPDAARREFEHSAHLWQEIGAPYETALARLGLAHAHRAASNEAQALLEFESARGAFERLGATREAAQAASALGEMERTTSPQGHPHDGSHAARSIGDRAEQVFRREGDYWWVVFDGAEMRIRDVKGMRYIARLLANPGREFHALDLVASEHGSVREMHASTAANSEGYASRSDAGVLLDSQAKEAYRRRLAEIDDDIEQAEALQDGERSAQAQLEREFLIRELSRAVGLGGRDRRAGSASERARASVTRAIRHAMTRIGQHHPSLGAHLGHAIRTGTCCAYVPDPRIRVAWTGWS